MKLVRQFEAYASGGQPKNIVHYSWRHETMAPTVGIRSRPYAAS